MLQDASSLADLASRTFMAVGPSRIAAVTLALLSREAGEDRAQSAYLATARDRLDTAIDVLQTRFDAELGKEGFEATPTLRAQKDEALTHLLDLRRRAFGGASEVSSEFCLGKLEPAVTRFLETMNRELGERHAQWRDLRRDTALQAVSNVDALGRSIHMIAINASIEAARAGDSGRGFMVIAKEIKSLASRSETLIGDVQNHIEKS